VSSKEPIRLFRSDFLEFFTHIHPAVVLVIWLPAIGYFVARAVLARQPGVVPLYLPIGYVIGLLVWTLFEYTLHRFVFHFRPRVPWQERLSFIFHGVHHAQPMSKTRLVMPPALSIPLGVLVYVLFWLVIDLVLGLRLWLFPVFAGTLSGYVVYDMLHYSTHHFKVQWRWFRYIRRYHLRHHTQTPELRFGVSSPLWDIVFGTKPAEQGGRVTP
jgi:sterol desaturase/sphingolipid hydroxylase (fatty acid hydroxylase superfamily)